METPTILAIEALETSFCRSMRISSCLPSSLDLPKAPLGRPSRLQFAPRIRDLGAQRLYRLDAPPRKEGVAVLLKGLVRSKTLLDNWDEFLRVAGSLKSGWVTASLLISKLQAGVRQNALTRALREYGRLVKTCFILQWIKSEDYRRRIHRQLNKGEALHALRRFLFFAHEGKVRRRQTEQQTDQILCLNLVTNAIVTWNTVYMNAAIERLRAEGRIGRDIDLGHLSPAPGFKVSARWYWAASCGSGRCAVGGRVGGRGGGAAGWSVHARRADPVRGHGAGFPDSAGSTDLT